MHRGRAARRGTAACLAAAATLFASAATALTTHEDPARTVPVAIAFPSLPPVIEAPAATTTEPEAAPAAAPATAPLRAAAPAKAAPALPAKRLQAALDTFLAAHPGLTVSVGVALAEPGSPMWQASTTPLAAEPYGVLSITKTFTEALVLREAAAGRIDLDAPMPELEGVVPAPADVVITPRMLLQHTSGVVNYMSAVGYDPTATVTPAQLVSLSLKSPLLFPPGTSASYSNTNFHWLGLLLEHATGATFADLVRGLALEVGLPATALDPNGRPGWIGYASGGIRSTVADMTRWGAALFTPGRVLAPAELDKLTTLGPLGVTHGLWPVAGGLGQQVAHGGLVYYPADNLVVVARIEPASPETGPQLAALAGSLRAAAAVSQD